MDGPTRCSRSSCRKGKAETEISGARVEIREIEGKSGRDEGEIAHLQHCLGGGHNAERVAQGVAQSVDQARQRPHRLVERAHVPPHRAQPQLHRRESLGTVVRWSLGSR